MLLQDIIDAYRRKPTKVEPPSAAPKLTRVVTIPNGPFKGRTYIKNADGSLGQRVFLPKAE